MNSSTQLGRLLSNPKFQSAKKELLAAIREASEDLRLKGATPASSDGAREQFKKSLQEFTQDRGRDLFFPYLSSGFGAGPWVELVDGSVKLDLITGIGINFFGHSSQDFLSTMIDELTADPHQGNLQPGREAQELIHALLSRVGTGSRLKHTWLTTCGTMANEIALKIIRQKKYPATKVLAFRDCFCGRSTAMQEITDNPKYREGQPVYGEAYYLSFYDPKLGLEKSLERSLGEMREHFNRYPGKFAALMLEIVQGEGGFNFAPREFYTRLFDEAKKAGLAIWADEIQTFGRTGELFAYQTFGLAEYMDVVTIAKMLQAAAVLYTPEFNPKAGLVAGTFSGGSSQLGLAKRTLELLDEGKYLGKDGRIAKLSERFLSGIGKLSETSCRGMISETRGLGGMIAFQPFSGSLEDTKAVLMKLFDLGCVAFYCGHGPYLVRMLPPFGAMTAQDVDTACGMIEKALIETNAGLGSKK